MKILTNRNYATWPSYQIVWEWEDYIANNSDFSLITDSKIINWKWFKRFNLFQNILVPKDNVFIYEVSVSNSLKEKRRYNRPNVVPCIVDYYFKDNEMPVFEKKFCQHKVVFLSSKEVFERLKELGCSLNIRHLPLSLSDIYSIKANQIFEKKYDLVMMGRQNKVLKEFLDIYIKRHSNFNYVYEDITKGKLNYVSSNGDYVGYIKDRNMYMNLLSQSRVALYSTPGIDGGEMRTNGYNQVTPKFLEYLASGCHIIARWKDNPDTDFYELSRFSENVDDYKTFEILMDKARNTDPNIKMYSEYLKGHYTSSIVQTIRSVESLL